MKKYKVGYCRPPKHTQFKKGVSGNPSGRPMGSVNMATVLQKELSQMVVVGQGNQKKRITKMQAAVKQLVDKALQGDMHAFRVLSVLTQVLNDPAGAPTSAGLEAADQKVLDILVRSFTAAQSTQN